MTSIFDDNEVKQSLGKQDDKSIFNDKEVQKAVVDEAHSQMQSSTPQENTTNDDFPKAQRAELSPKEPEPKPNELHGNVQKNYQQWEHQRQQVEGSQPESVEDDITAHPLNTAIMAAIPEAKFLKVAKTAPLLMKGLTYEVNKLIAGGIWGIGQTALDKVEGHSTDLVNNVTSLALGNAVLAPLGGVIGKITAPITNGAIELAQKIASNKDVQELWEHAINPRKYAAKTLREGDKANIKPIEVLSKQTSMPLDKLPPQSEQIPNIAKNTIKGMSKQDILNHIDETGNIPYNDYYYHVSQNKYSGAIPAYKTGKLNEPVVWFSENGPLGNHHGGHVYAIPKDLVKDNLGVSPNRFPVHSGDVPLEKTLYLGKLGDEPFDLHNAFQNAEHPTGLKQKNEEQPENKNQEPEINKEHKEMAYDIISKATGKAKSWLKSQLEGKAGVSTQKRRDTIQSLIENSGNKIDQFEPAWSKYFGGHDFYNNSELNQGSDLAKEAFKRITGKDFEIPTSSAPEDAHYNAIAKTYNKALNIFKNSKNMAAAENYLTKNIPLEDQEQVFKHFYNDLDNIQSGKEVSGLPKGELKTRKTYTSLGDSNISNDEVQKSIAPHSQYEAISNEDSLNQAQSLDKETARKLLDSDNPSALQTTANIDLLRKAVGENQVKEIDDLGKILMERNTSLGQAIQANTIIKKMSPEGAILATIKNMDEKVPAHVKTVLKVGKSTIKELDDVANKVISDLLDHDFKVKMFTASPEAFGLEGEVHSDPQITKLAKIFQKTITSKKNPNGLKIGDIVKTHYEQQGKSIDAAINATKDSLMKNGFTEEKAKAITDELRSGLNKVIEKRRKSLLNQKFGGLTHNQKSSLVSKILELHNIGALDEESYYNTISKRLKIPQLTPELVQKIKGLSEKVQSLPDGREKEIASQQLLMEIAKQKSTSAFEKALSVRAAIMLSNPKTAIKNITGHGVFGLLDSLSQYPAALADNILSWITGNRTLVAPQYKALFKGMVEEAPKAIQDSLMGIDTTGRRSPLALPNAQNEFIPKPIRQYIDLMHSAPYRVAYEGAYQESLANQIKAAGVNAATDEMKQQANLEALKRSFQDENKLSNFALGTVRILNKLMPGLGTAIEPFPKVPSNLLARALEYPAGIYNIIKEVKPLIIQGDTPFNQRNLALSIGRTAVGAYITYNAYVLAKEGILKGSSENGRYYSKDGLPQYTVNSDALLRKLQGENSTPRIGDHYTSYDWLKPVSSIVGIGANLGQEDPKNILDVMMSMSKTASSEGIFNDLVGDSPDGKSLGEKLKSKAESFPASYESGAIKGVTDTIDNTSRKTKDDNPVKETLNKLQANTPILSKNLPANVSKKTGEAYQKNENSSLLNNLLNPSKTTTAKETPITNKPTEKKKSHHKKSSEFNPDSTF